MPAIDVGASAIDRGTIAGSGWTRISKENPANATGTLEHVAVFFNTNALNVTIVIFQKVGVNTFTTRSFQAIGNFPSGYSEHDVSLPIVAGDYIGFYAAGGNLDRDDFGDGYWGKSGYNVDVVNKLFTFYANRTMSLYGYTIVPPSLYTHFTIKDIEYTPNCKTVTVVTHTDVECHQYLRYTDKSPRKHPRSLIVRGLTTQYDLRTCFVAYHDAEQEEAGDTLEHTFILTPLLMCHAYHFYFWAKSGESVMKYTSAIFSFWFPFGQPPFLTCDKAELAVTNAGFCQYWNANSQTFSPDHDYKVHHVSLMLNQFSTTRRGPYCVKITRNIPPCWNEPLIAIDYGSSLALPSPGVKRWKSWWGLTPTLLVGNAYRIVVHTLPGWESWDGEDWVPDEAAAAIQWWVSGPTDPYPHGAHQVGCNFQAGEGSWEGGGAIDATFRIYQLCPSLPS